MLISSKFFISLSILFYLHLSCASAQSFKFFKSISDNSSSPSLLISKPDESIMVQGNREGSIITRSIEDGSFIKQISVHSRNVNYLGFNSTGRLLISTSDNGEIKVYDFMNDKIIHRLNSSQYEGVQFALFSIADGFIYFNGKGRLYKTRSDLTQEVQKIYDFTDSITAGVITDDRSALIISLGKQIYVINTRTDEIIQQFYSGDSPIEKLCLMPDYRMLGWSKDGTIQIWKISLGQIQTPALAWFKAGSPGNISFSHDGKWMLTGNVGTWARIWKPMEKNIEQELLGHSGPVTAYAFSANDKTIFTASEDHTIRIWKQKLDSIIPPPPPIVEKLVTPPPAVQHIQPPIVIRDAQMESKNVPSHIKGRIVKKTETIQLKKSQVDILIFDNEMIDGDTLSLFFNGEWILKNYCVVREKKKITLYLLPKTNNYFVLFAENLGSKPPNTAVVQFSDGHQNRTLRLSSDLSRCSAINFLYK